jgi:hypothetical protein
MYILISLVCIHPKETKIEYITILDVVEPRDSVPTAHCSQGTSYSW